MSYFRAALSSVPLNSHCILNTKLQIQQENSHFHSVLVISEWSFLFNKVNVQKYIFSLNKLTNFLFFCIFCN